MNPCEHPNMQATARVDSCPDCGYTFYYGDAHAENEDARISREIHPGDPKRAKKYQPPKATCPNCGSTDLAYDANAKLCNSCNWFRVYG